MQLLVIIFTKYILILVITFTNKSQIQIIVLSITTGI